MLFKVSRLVFYCGAGLLCLFNSNVFAGKTTQISSSSNILPDAFFEKFKMSANGRYTVFSALVDGKFAIFVHDYTTNKTEKISKLDAELNTRSFELSNVSSDGRYIELLQNKLSVLSGHFIPTTIFSSIYDRLTNKIEHTTLPQPLGNPLNTTIRDTTYISGNGRYFVFEEHTAVTTTETFIYDRLTHKAKSIYKDILQIDTSSPFGGIVIEELSPVAINEDGRYVLLAKVKSLDSSPTPIIQSKKHGLYVYDQYTHKMERIDVSSSGKNANGEIAGAYTDITPDGRYVTFSSYASNLVAGDTNQNSDVFVRDRLTHKTERVNVSSKGEQGNGTDVTERCPAPFWCPVHLSADGRYVAFTSDATNLVPNDTNKENDIFVHDRATHTTERVNVGYDGKQAKSDRTVDVSDFSFSADGRYVTFRSVANNLVNNEHDNDFDIFIHDRLLDTIHHADLTINPTQKPATLKLNTQGTYLYTITNDGKDSVPDVSLIHLVSDGSAVSFKPSQGTCSFSPAETVCHLGQLAAGKKLTLSVTVKAQSKAFSQQVTVSGAPLDIKPINNQISVTTPIK